MHAKFALLFSGEKKRAESLSQISLHQDGSLQFTHVIQSHKLYFSVHTNKSI